MPLSPAVIAYARAHHGLIDLDAWVRAGHGRSSFHKAVRAGVLERVTAGVAALPGTTVGPLQQLAGAVMRHGPGVMLSHRSSAWSWGVPIDPGPVTDLITRRREQRTTDATVRIHHPDDRGRLRPRHRHGLPVTAPLRTLLDVGARDADAVVPTLETMVRAGLLTVPAIVAGLERWRRRGRPGIAALEGALRDLGALVTDSELETVMRRLFRRAGIDGWTFHERVAGYEVDFCFAAKRVIVEVDGWLFHGARRGAWERDLARDAHLQARGWLVHHVSWRIVTGNPDACVRTIAAILARR